MKFIDYFILLAYGLGLIAFAYFVSRRKNTDQDEEFYLGSKNLGAGHIGLSVAATDVGGGFSIGLGALGFTLGLSGSWLLFTGLVGALLSSIILIPRLKLLELDHSYFSYPQVIKHYFGSHAAHLAALISFIGYLAFTSAQLMAGTKLASVLIPGLSFSAIMIILTLISVIYTSIGGLRAVVLTDTIQWTLVVLGLGFIAIPLGIIHLGGIEHIVERAGPESLSLTQLSFQTLINWMISIVPIWFVAMTLYQRIFACKDEREAKRAWYIAGFFEWPVMAFLGVGMGVLAKVAFLDGLLQVPSTGGDLDPELAIPLFLKTVLPTGLLGLLFVSYLSAILSTADSCLMAASGNLYSDFLTEKKWTNRLVSPRVITFSLGLLALALGLLFDSVLKLMLHAYGFMISGLLIPTLAIFLTKKTASSSALISMVVGILSYLMFTNIDTGGWNANLFGISFSAIAYIGSDYINEYLNRNKRISKAK